MATDLINHDGMVVTEFAGPYVDGDRRMYQITTADGSYVQITRAQLMAIAGLNPLGDFIEMLQAWLDLNRQSPLDGTVSCKDCRALVLEDNLPAHMRRCRNNIEE